MAPVPHSDELDQTLYYAILTFIWQTSSKHKLPHSQSIVAASIIITDETAAELTEELCSG